MEPALVLLSLASALSGVARAQDVPTLSVDGVRDASDENIAFLGWKSPRPAYFLGEPIDVTLRFGFEQRFFEEDLVQLFRRELDVPVQAQVPLDELPGLQLESASTSSGVSFAFSDRIVRGQRSSVRMDARTYVVVELPVRLSPDRTGELVVPGGLLRFAHATLFREDFFGRLAEDRLDAFVRGTSLSVRVLALPTTDRPEIFPLDGGPVGRFTVTASAEPRDLVVGDSLKLFLSIDGSGNLDVMAPPRVHDVRGFAVLGWIEEPVASGRTFVFDLAPELDTVRAVPPIPLAFFDPERAEYRTVVTAPIPILVRPKPEAARQVDRSARSRRPESEATPTASLVFGAVLSVLALALGLFLIKRLLVRARRPSVSANQHVHSAATAFRASIDHHPGLDVGDAFAAFLAVSLDCTPAALVGPDLPVRLRRAGVPDELAKRTAATLEDLTAPRYGGRSSADGPAVARALVGELEGLLGRPTRTAR